MLSWKEISDPGSKWEERLREQAQLGRGWSWVCRIYVPISRLASTPT